MKRLFKRRDIYVKGLGIRTSQRIDIRLPLQFEINYFRILSLLFKRFLISLKKTLKKAIY